MIIVKSKEYPTETTCSLSSKKEEELPSNQKVDSVVQLKIVQITSQKPKYLELLEKNLQKGNILDEELRFNVINKLGGRSDKGNPKDSHCPINIAPLTMPKISQSLIQEYGKKFEGLNLRRGCVDGLICFALRDLFYGKKAAARAVDNLINDLNLRVEACKKLWREKDFIYPILFWTQDNLYDPVFKDYFLSAGHALGLIIKQAKGLLTIELFDPQGEIALNPEYKKGFLVFEEIIKFWAQQIGSYKGEFTTLLQRVPFESWEGEGVCYLHVAVYVYLTIKEGVSPKEIHQIYHQLGEKGRENFVRQFKKLFYPTENPKALAEEFTILVQTLKKELFDAMLEKSLI